MKRALFLSLAASFSLPSAFAGGHDVRNGGNATVCYKDPSFRQVESITLFDYWEQRAMGRPAIDLGSDQVDVKGKIELFLGRVRRYDPDLAKSIQIESDRLLAELNRFLVDDLPTAPIPDDHPEANPTGNCRKEQFAVQIRDPEPGTPRFLVNRRLYANRAADNDARAGILLHEAIYRVAIQTLRHSNSDGARRINSFYASTSVFKIDAVELRAFYASQGFPFLEASTAYAIPQLGLSVLATPPASGPILTLDAPLYYDDGRLKFTTKTVEIAFDRGIPVATRIQGERGYSLNGTLKIGAKEFVVNKIELGETLDRSAFHLISSGLSMRVGDTLVACTDRATLTGQTVTRCGATAVALRVQLGKAVFAAEGRASMDFERLANGDLKFYGDGNGKAFAPLPGTDVYLGLESATLSPNGEIRYGSSRELRVTASGHSFSTTSFISFDALGDRQIRVAADPDKRLYAAHATSPDGNTPLMVSSGDPRAFANAECRAGGFDGAVASLQPTNVSGTAKFYDWATKTYVYRTDEVVAVYAFTCFLEGGHSATLTVEDQPVPPPSKEPRRPASTWPNSRS